MKQSLSTRFSTFVTASLALFLLAVTATGCSGPTPETKKPAKQAQESAPAAEPAKPAAPKEEAVGPDGPESIPYGGVDEISTDPAVIKNGEDLFNSKGCVACHRMDMKLVGPALGGVAERRTVKWMARMIQHPEMMLEKDPVAKQLLATHFTPMANQGVTPEEAKAIISYLATQKAVK